MGKEEVFPSSIRFDLQSDVIHLFGEDTFGTAFAMFKYGEIFGLDLPNELPLTFGQIIEWS